MSQPSPYPFKPSSRYSPPFAHQHQSSAGIGLLLSAAEMLDEGASFPYDNHQLPLLDTSAIPAFQSRYYPPSHQSPFQDSRFQLRQESSHYRSSTPLPFNAPTLPSQQQRTSSSWPGGTDRSLHSSAAMTVSRPQLGRRSFASTSIAMPSESLQDSTLSPSLPRTSPLMRNRPASLKRAQTAISCLRCRSVSVCLLSSFPSPTPQFSSESNTLLLNSRLASWKMRHTCLRQTLSRHISEPAMPPKLKSPADMYRVCYSRPIRSATRKGPVEGKFLLSNSASVTHSHASGASTEQIFGCKKPEVLPSSTHPPLRTRNSCHLFYPCGRRCKH